MPKRMRKEIDRRFAASVARQYTEKYAALGYDRAAKMGQIYNSFQGLQSPENPFVDRVRDSFRDYLGTQGELAREMRKTAAIRLKKERGIELGRRERFRLWRSNRNAAKLEAKLDDRYRDMREYTDSLRDEQASDDLRRFLDAADAVIIQSRTSPEETMDMDTIAMEAYEESGYRPEMTDEERAVLEQDNARLEELLGRLRVGPEAEQEAPAAEEEIDYDARLEELLSRLKVGPASAFRQNMQELHDKLEEIPADERTEGIEDMQENLDEVLEMLEDPENLEDLDDVMLDAKAEELLAEADAPEAEAPEAEGEPLSAWEKFQRNMDELRDMLAPKTLEEMEADLEIRQSIAEMDVAAAEREYALLKAELEAEEAEEVEAAEAKTAEGPKSWAEFRACLDAVYAEMQQPATRAALGDTEAVAEAAAPEAAEPEAAEPEVAEPEAAEPEAAEEKAAEKPAAENPARRPVDPARLGFAPKTLPKKEEKTASEAPEKKVEKDARDKDREAGN